MTKRRFKHWLFAVLPCAVVAVLYTFQVSHHSFRGLLGLEILWNFSIILEPLASSRRARLRFPHWSTQIMMSAIYRRSI